MGEPGANEVTVTNDELTVQKSLDRDQFDALTFIYTISSLRDERVRVRLIDDIPEGVSSDDVGFHPEYNANNWQIEADQLIYTDEVPPDGEIITVYGLRNDEELAPEVTEPTVDLNVESQREPVEPPHEKDSDRQFLTGNIEQDTSEDVPEPEDSAMSTSNTPDDATATQEVTSASPLTAQEADPAVFMEVLLEALETDDGSNEYQDRFRDALGIQTGSLEARIEHLQSQMLDLSAYTDSLEEFLDGSGTADKIQENLGELEEAISDVEDRVDSNTAAVRDLESEISELSRDAESIQAEFENLEALRADIEDLEAFREQLSMAVTEALNE